jgi:hypothetical protein
LMPGQPRQIELCQARQPGQGAGGGEHWCVMCPQRPCAGDALWRLSMRVVADHFRDAGGQRYCGPRPSM